MTMITAEEITKDWGERCPDFNRECGCCQMWIMHDEIERLSDKVDGLESDLDNAVETAYKRGAEEWTKLNYPSHYERFKGRDNGNQ